MDRAYEVPLYRTNAGYEIEAKVITHNACVTLFLDLLKCLKDLPFVTSKRVEELVVSRERERSPSSKLASQES